MPISLPRKTSWTIAALILLLASLPYAPGPRRFAGLTLVDLEKTLLFPTTSPPLLAMKPKPLPPHSNRDRTDTPKVEYLDVPPGSLATFFTALGRSERREPGAITRVLHYGDSPTTADSITSDVRALLQKRFGDAGHGFLLIAPPWAWYGHNGMQLTAHGWHIEPASLSRAPDGIHGLGGVSFRGSTGASSIIHYPEGHTRGTVYYLAQPGGGTFTVTANAASLIDMDTGSPTKSPGFAEFDIPASASELQLRVTSGQVRLFGYRFDKPGPGVQYSSLGINGAQVQMMLRYFAVDQWKTALRHEQPDLVVLNYGTNESIYPAYLDKDYPGELRKVIARIREAVPHASLLLMSPMDRGVMDSSREVTTPDALVRLIDIQKSVATETGCAFFDTFRAMGGAGTMGRWYNVQPRLVSADFMHPLPAGAAKVGLLFEDALLKEFELSQSNSKLVSKK